MTAVKVPVSTAASARDRYKTVRFGASILMALAPRNSASSAISSRYLGTRPAAAIRMGVPMA